MNKQCSKILALGYDILTILTCYGEYCGMFRPNAFCLGLSLSSYLHHKHPYNKSDPKSFMPSLRKIRLCSNSQRPRPATGWSKVFIYKCRGDPTMRLSCALAAPSAWELGAYRFLRTLPVKSIKLSIRALGSVLPRGSADTAFF